MQDPETDMGQQSKIILLAVVGLLVLWAAVMAGMIDGAQALASL